MAISQDDIQRASQKTSLAGGLCQLSGALLAVIGGLLTLGTAMNGGGAGALLLGGSATLALAMAGAPIAALGSIANSQKASKELLLLQVKASAAEPPRRWEPDPPAWEGPRNQGAGAPPPPPPPRR